MNSSTDSPPEYAKGGLITGPGWKSIAKMSFDTDPYEYGAKWSGGSVGEQRIPDSLCPNCRRDRHDYPLTSAVAQMWSDLSFDEGYDPNNDDSEIICPGSDVHGPALADHGSRATTYVDTISHMSITLDALNSSTLNLLKKIAEWPNPFLPLTDWKISPKSSWTIADLEKLKDQWEYKPAVQGAPWVVFPDEAYEFKQECLDQWIEPFAPIPQAALEAAPKAIEHEIPQPPGFDFDSFKKDFDSIYPTGKKKRK